MSPVTSKFVCKVTDCAKTFSSSSHLRRHERTHLDVRPYVCEHCGKSFGRKEVWQRHEAIHTVPSPQASRSGSSTSTSNRRSFVVTRPDPVGDEDDRESNGTDAARSPSASSHSGVHISAGQSYSPRHAQVTTSLFPDNMAWNPGMPSEIIATNDSAANAVDPPALASMDGSGPVGNLGQSTQQGQNSESLDLSNWLSQPTGLLFDEEVYGWMDQMLSSMEEGGLNPSVVNNNTSLPPTDDVYIDQNHTSTRSNHLATPVLTADIETRLMWMWQGLGLVMDVAISPETKPSKYFELGWKTIMARYPIIHPATFDINACPTSFLSSIVALGVVQSSDDSDRLLARQLVPLVRAMVVAESLDNPKTRLQTIQSFLIVAIAGEFLNMQNQHQAQGMVSHVMSIMRRFGYLYMTGMGDLTTGEPEQQWRSWAEQESRRRTLWLCWMLDIRSVTLGHHFGSRARSPFRMIIELPCRHDCWSAIDSFSWSHRLHPCETIPSTLKKTLTNDWSRDWFSDDQVDFARLVLIHALAALAWDLSHRDLMLPPELATQEPSRIAVALVCGMQRLGQHPTLVTDGPPPLVTPLVAEAYDLSMAASLDVLVDLVNLEVFCGVNCVGMIQKVDTLARLEANAKIRAWCFTQKASQAVMVAAAFLTHSIENANRWPASISHSWTIYFAFSVLWAYAACRSDNSSGLLLDQSPRSYHDGMINDMNCGTATDAQKKRAIQHCNEANAYVRSDNQSRYQANGLLELGLAALHLMKKTRADIVCDQVNTIGKILSGLVAQR